MKVSDYIAESLALQGVTCAFEVIGGMTTYLIDALYRHRMIEVVTTHHEQAAAFAADAMARITGIPGVALATSGPGATNLITGIGSCFFDSVPALFLTGQVNRNEQKGSRNIRQLGFQETDIVALVQSITKASWKIEDPDQVPELIEKAFRMALNGRPGPVLMDIPMDVQRADISRRPKKFSVHDDRDPVDPKMIAGLLRALKDARRPLILAGGGIRSANASGLFRKFVALMQVPVVNSLMAVDVLPFEDPLRVGLIGSYGNRWANLALGRADLILVLGSRLDIRQTGADIKAFQSGRTIYHVDIEAGEINNRLKGCHPILADLADFLTLAGASVKPEEFHCRAEWLGEIGRLRESWPDTLEPRAPKGINPNSFMHALSRGSAGAAAFVVDVGNHQMWAAQSLELGAEQKFLTSGGLGAMGFALPAAIGASYALSGRPIVMISGDGGMQFNIHELETIAHHRLPVRMIVINNQSLGMVRQFQQSYFESRYPSTVWGYSAPNFARIAEAYGIDSGTVQDESGIPEALNKMWSDPKKPYLLQVMVDASINAYPKIAFGRPMTDMEPLAKPTEIEGT